MAHDDEVLRPAQHDESDADGSYRVKVVCRNCHEENAVSVPRGERVGRVACPTCGVPDLRPQRPL